MHEGLLKDMYEKYERYVAPFAFVLGFVWDNLMLIRIDLWLDNLIILAHLILAGLWIAVLTLYEGRRLRGRAEVIGHLAPIFLQFSLGALFSAFFIFYWRSASFAASWPFLVVLATLLLGNEFFRHRYQQLTFRMSIYFIALYSYSIFAVPLMYKKIGVNIFLLSGIVSLILVGASAFLLSYVIPRELRQSRRPLLVSIGSIYMAFHVLYFFNIIPPIPLSMKEGGVYHHVMRTADGGYQLEQEKTKWYDFLIQEKEFHWVPGSGVYAYSAVFTPTRLDAVIAHRWEHFDDDKKSWIETDRLQFPITGGRDGGYRGYSVKTAVTPGRWRVDVITDKGQVLGRLSFRIVDVATIPEMAITMY